MKETTTTYETQLKEIIRAVTIVSANTYKIYDKIHHAYRATGIQSHTGKLSEFGSNRSYHLGEELGLLTQSLSSILYKQFYAGMQNLEIGRKFYPLRVEREAFMKELSAANQSKEGFDLNWRIYHINDAKEIFVEKNGELRLALRKNFVSEKAADDLVEGDTIDLYVPRENKKSQLFFYYMYGEAFYGKDNDTMRIYWNLQIEGMPTLLTLISKIFNTYRVPFTFKCINHHSRYDRNDNAILYFRKDHLMIVKLIIQRIVPKIKPYLNKEVPLFTKKLTDGVSLAEDPGNQESFGTNCCKAIAEALVLAFMNKISNDQLFDLVKKTLHAKGIPPNRMAFHPHSQHYLLDTEWF